MPLQIRRGTDAERLAMIQALAPGELVYVTDSQRLYIGNGTTMGGVAITGYTNEDAQDAAGAALTAGNSSNSGITFTYDDTGNKITAAVGFTAIPTNIGLNGHNITGTGNISIEGYVHADFKGSVYGEDSTQLVNAQDVSIRLDNTIVGNAVPKAGVVADLGSSANRFRTLYVTSSGGLDIGGAIVTSNGSSVNLPAGSTINGHPISPLDGAFTRLDIKGSVFGDDSSMLVDGVAGTIKGPVNTSTVNASSYVISPVIDAGSNTSNGTLNIWNSSDVFATMFSTTGGAYLDFHISRGTLTAPTATQVNDYLSGFLLKGYTGSGYARAIAVTGQQDGAVVNSNIPGKFVISAQNYLGTGDYTYTFNSRGVFETQTTRLTPFSNNTTRDTVLSSPAAGMIVYNTAAGAFQVYNGAWTTIVTGDKIGYSSGVGDIVTQGSSGGKATPVTINKISGNIILNNASLSGNSGVSFTVSNSTVTVDDVVILNIRSSETNTGSYAAFVTNVANNSFTVTIRNFSASPIAEAISLNFAVIKAASN